MSPPAGRSQTDDELLLDRLTDRFDAVPPDVVRAIAAAVLAEQPSAGLADGSVISDGSVLSHSSAASSVAAVRTPGPRPDKAASDAENALTDADLRDGLASLAQLALGKRGLPEMLTHIAEFAVRAIPGADGAGLTLFQNDRQDTIVATASFVRAVDTVQYELNEGPCILAAAERISIRSGSLSTDPAFPRFGPEADRLGVHSVLSLPLMNDGAALGTMNVYAHRRHAFDERAMELGELFALPASISVLNAQTLAQAQRLASRLQLALDVAAQEVASVVDILLRPTSGGLSS